MKARRDFVTNSSSSSFIIAKRKLDQDQIKAIREHFSLGKKMGLVDAKWDYPYSIDENDDFITGYVDMDNFTTDEFLNRIDMNDTDIVWGEYPFDIDNQTDNSEENENSMNWRRLIHED